MYNPIINDIKKELRLSNRLKIIGRVLLIVSILLLCIVLYNKSLLLIVGACSFCGSITSLILIFISNSHRESLNEALNIERWKDDVKRTERRNNY